eukprot:SAG11_NODE_298_length_11076_cov_4.253621_1_plen_91_part_00
MVSTVYSSDIPLAMLRSDCVVTPSSDDPGAPKCNVILIMKDSSKVFFAHYDLVVTAETPGDSQAHPKVKNINLEEIKIKLSFKKIKGLFV